MERAVLLAKKQRLEDAFQHLKTEETNKLKLLIWKTLAKKIEKANYVNSTRRKEWHKEKEGIHYAFQLILNLKL